ncbi:MAG TPA: phosphatase PAP2 family protein [Candidatus Saccharimonadales bacterium]|nr:phosphatase PAP2 family protein [Candidatus Saccharimonadales bacterium]
MNAKTDTTIYDGHRGWYIASLVVAVLTLGAATALAIHTKHAIPTWETSIFHHINDWPASLKMAGIVITMIGGSVWAALASIAIATVARFHRLAWRLAAVIIGGYGLDFVLKQLVDRGRPADLLADFHRYSVETGAGFPSGHTTIATVISLTLLPYLPKAWRWLPIAWIGLVALSRVYLGVHLPLDVLGGFLVGLLVVSLTRILPQPLRVFLRLD